MMQVQERRAMRGLAASARLQGQYRSAIKHLERVLEISQETKEHTGGFLPGNCSVFLFHEIVEELAQPSSWFRCAGDADAYGTIADCFTDLGEFDKAAAFYDKYIETMNREGPV
jgi:tetratricopeptide (TPR) repeat protein